MAKTEKEFQELKKTVKEVSKEPKELSEEELEQISGGRLTLKLEEGGGDGSYLTGVHSSISSLKAGQ